MIGFPNAKINLGLNVIQKRTDGFHDIETIFFPVALFDIVEIVENEHNDVNKKTVYSNTKLIDEDPIVLGNGIKVFFSTSGLPVDSDPSSNLCIKACRLYNERHTIPFDIKIHLHKVIPMGAGLGGGSADAAEVLKLLNVITKMNLKTEQLISMASELGSDCAFFINNRSAFAEGRGELLQDIPVDLSEYSIAIVKPDIHVSTQEAFANIQPKNSRGVLMKCMKSGIKEWKNCMVNDFEESIFRKYPEISRIKSKLYLLGAEFASLSGSGSAVYGIFKNHIGLKNEFQGKFYVDTPLTNFRITL